MLGADLIGFHIQAHCNNFLETVDRALESRIEWEHFAVNARRPFHAVRPFPDQRGLQWTRRLAPANGYAHAVSCELLKQRVWKPTT